MKKKDIHNLIEQQDPEGKQRLWERIQSQLNLAPAPQQTAVKAKPKMWKWAVAVAVLVVVTLSVVLPLTLKGDGVRYCDITQYTTESLGQTLRDYSLSHNHELLYVDWYDISDEIVTDYAHINDDKSDIVFFEESMINIATGIKLMILVTDSKTRVDKVANYDLDCEELSVNNVNVKWKSQNFKKSFATFEYKNHIYYLQLDIGDVKDQMIEIIENMLNAN